MITTLMKQIRGLNRFSKLSNDGGPWVPNNLLKPGAKVKQFHTGDKPYKRDQIRSWLIRLECLKTNYIGSTSQASNDCKSLFTTASKLKNYPKLELVVPLYNHIQSMITGCINVFPLQIFNENKFQYSVREFYQDQIRNKKNSTF